MPSVSKSQQRLMGVAYAVKGGDMEISDVDPAYRDKVKSMVDGMTKKSLKKYASTKHDELPETVDEDFAHAAQNITPSANIGGMGPVVFPSDGVVGSGDVPAVADIDEEDEDEKKKDKTKKKLEMEGIKLFTQFGDFISESFDQRPGQLVKDLHFETDPEKAEEMKIEIGRRQGEVTARQQIEGGEYSLRRFRKDIKYGDGKDVGVFMPGSYDAATSKLGDGPHKKAVAKVKFNRKKYDQWVEDVASNDGWKNAFDMAQNAKFEPGLLQWAKKEFRGEDVMQRIQWDIEAYAESVVTEGKLQDQVKELVRDLDSFEYEVFAFDNDVDPEDANQMTDFIMQLSNKDAKAIIKQLSESVVTEAKDNLYLQLHKKYAEQIKGLKAGKIKKLTDLVSVQRYSMEERGDYFDMDSKKKKELSAEYAEERKLFKKYIGGDVSVMLPKGTEALAESTVKRIYEARSLDREEMMKFIERHMRIAGTSEEFAGSEGGIWVSGEDSVEFKGKIIYDYYAEGSGYELGVNVKWEKELNKRGWYSEWYDAGTIQIWPI